MPSMKRDNTINDVSIKIRVVPVENVDSTFSTGTTLTCLLQSSHYRSQDISKYKNLYSMFYICYI